MKNKMITWEFKKV